MNNLHPSVFGSNDQYDARDTEGDNGSVSVFASKQKGIDFQSNKTGRSERRYQKKNKTKHL